MINQNLDGVACRSTTQCVASGNGGSVLVFDPKNGSIIRTITPAETDGELVAVSCPPQDANCTVIDLNGTEVTLNPSTGHIVRTAGVDSGGTFVNVSAMSCPTASQCTIVDTSRSAITFDPTTGNKVASATMGSNGEGFASLACPTASECVMPDGNGNAIEFDPTSPGSAAAAFPVDPGQYAFVSCASGTDCVVADESGGEVEFDPTHPPVSPSPQATGSGGFAGLTCLPELSAGIQCTGYEHNGNVIPHEVTFDPSDPASGTPKSKAAINIGPDLGGMSCPTTSECVATDLGGRAATFNPAKPSAAVHSVLIESNPSNLLVSCPAISQCTTFDPSGNEVTFDPRHLPANPSPTAIDSASGQYFNGFSCPSVTRCVAVDESGADEITFNPRAPGAAKAPSTLGTNDLGPVSCPSATQCTALDSSGKEITFNPASPAGAKAHSIDAAASAISCPTVSRCVIGDNGGKEVTFNPKTPPATPHAVKVDKGPNDNAIYAIACPSVTQCTAFDEKGSEVTFNPASPGSPHVVAIPRATSIQAASCPSVSVCAAGDEQSIAFVGLAPPQNVKVPAITGTATVGEILTEHHGTWTGSPTSYRYQWFDCNSVGKKCSVIHGATGSTYRLASADTGHTIRVNETAVNAGGHSTAAMSPPTKVVTPRA
jgi:hypothetical protein